VKRPMAAFDRITEAPERAGNGLLEDPEIDKIPVDAVSQDTKRGKNQRIDRSQYPRKPIAQPNARSR